MEVKFMVLTKDDILGTWIMKLSFTADPSTRPSGVDYLEFKVEFPNLTVSPGGGTYDMASLMICTGASGIYFEREHNDGVDQVKYYGQKDFMNNRFFCPNGNDPYICCSWVRGNIVGSWVVEKNDEKYRTFIIKGMSVDNPTQAQLTFYYNRLSSIATRQSVKVYDNTYTIKSPLGSTLAELTEAPSMVKAKLSIVGNFKTLTLTGENDKPYTMEWESVTPDNNTFNGLSVKQGGSIIIPADGTEVEVNLTGSTNFYENYSIYRPPTTDFSVELYQNRAESNRVDKTNYLTSVGTLKGVLRDSTSISSLELTIEYPKFPDFNYIHIPAFNRYYFVNDIVAENNNLWTLYCRVDVLMTYKQGIYESKAFIDRTGYTGDYGDLIVDKNRAVQLGQTVNVLSVPVTDNIFEATGTSGYRQGMYVITGVALND